jgi:hypothetical protein
MVMQRYLLVLDMDLPGLNEELDLEPVNYLAGRHEQERGEVVVLSVAASRQVKLSPLELLLGAATAHGQSAPAKYPTAPQPGHHIHTAAEHRMNLAVRHLKTSATRQPASPATRNWSRPYVPRPAPTTTTR